MKETTITKYDSQNIDVDVDVEIDIDDVKEWLEAATTEEIKELYTCGYLDAVTPAFEVKTYDDEQKIELFKEVFNKYSVPELERRLC